MDLHTLTTNIIILLLLLMDTGLLVCLLKVLATMEDMVYSREGLLVDHQIITWLRLLRDTMHRLQVCRL